MALLHTPKADEAFTAPAFSLLDVGGAHMSFDDVAEPKGTVIAFICNHCPYVHAIIDRLVADFAALQGEGIGCAAVMPNDVAAYEADSYENMQAFARDNGFTFPYLLDESQEVARAFDAVCTPDIFGFNADGALQYRGRLDSAGPNPADGATRRDLLEAMRRIAYIGAGPHQQFASMGCSIKWRA